MYKPSPRSVTAPMGFTAAGTTCGIKRSSKPDLALIVSDRPCVAAGVFTQNKLPGAPVTVAKRRLASARRGKGLRAVICNSGIANDATGDEGVRNALQSCSHVAQAIGCAATQVLPSSTGLIGPQLPMQKIATGVVTLGQNLKRGKAADTDAARAIMTTDLVPKSAIKTITFGQQKITVGGIAKGSGMIAPNMATMLVFITTDAAIEPSALQQALKQAVAVSFNRISVDQHTSPSDMVIVLANGAAENRIIKQGQPLATFTDALTDVCKSLAYQIVQDGEGAERVFRVDVTNAKSERDADRIGHAIVNSPLVKTAVHGCDPNWGRIVTAAGNSGAAITPGKMSLWIGPKKDVCVFDHGTPIEPKAKTLKQLDRLMQQREVVFSLDIGRGKSAVQWLGCDLSKQYVTINADYTT